MPVLSALASPLLVGGDALGRKEPHKVPKGHFKSREDKTSAWTDSTLSFLRDGLLKLQAQVREAEQSMAVLNSRGEELPSRADQLTVCSVAL